MQWKKGSALLLALMLLLTGCSGEASLVGDALVASMDKPNYDFQGSFKVTGDLPAAGEHLGEEQKALMQALQAGVTVKGSQLDLNHAKVVVELPDDRLLRDRGLWTGDRKASAELLIDRDVMYVTTPLDTKYLRVQLNPEENGVDPKKLEAFREQMNKLTLSFLRSYISDYGFPFSQVKNLGRTTVELPDGQKQEATHIAISLDLPELVRLLLYTAKDAATSEKVRTFAVDAIVLYEQFLVETRPSNGEPVSEDALRARAEQMVDEIRNTVKLQTAALEQRYTVDQLVADIRQKGLSDFTLKLDYYISADKLPLRSTVDLSLTLKDEKGTHTIGFATDSLMWNYGKATPFSVPAADQTVPVEQIAKDKQALNAFHKNGFLYALLREMTKQTRLIVLDLKEGTAQLNGEPAKGVRPYTDHGTTMVPIRFVGEAMGAHLSYDAKTKTTVLVKDGKRIELSAGSSLIKVNGQPKTMPAAAQLKNGSMYVPLRVVSDELGADVTWIPEEHQVVVQFSLYGE